MSDNIIGIHTFSVSTEISDFARTGIYRAVPVILYKINDETVQHFLIRRPIEIFRENMEYGNLRSVVRGGEKFLSIPGRTYDQMRNYVNQNVNKVIADMITHVVISVIDDLNGKDSKDKNIFFIDSVETNKIIGRLGYLYLRSDSNTIAFVTYKSGGLLTDVLNEGNEKIKFDINYFQRQESQNENHSAIIPNDYMESLTQIVFYNLSTSLERVSPLRCDILSQGISTSQIQEKVNAIERVLADSNNVTLPYREAGNNWTIIPKNLFDCIEAEQVYSREANDILGGGLHGSNW